MRRLALILVVVLAACENQAGDSLQGYIEGESLLLASPYAGQLERLSVRRGERVEPGQALFALEQAAERAAYREALERLKGTEARLENLRAGRRAPELDALRAQLAQAQTAAELSAAELARAQELRSQGFVAQSRVDEARSAHQRDRSRIAEAEAQLRNARLPLGRDAEREAAEAEIAAARAAAAQAQWRLEQKTVAAPVGGLVQDTFFVAGEWVAAGRPVVSLLPPGNVKVRFYVPQTLLGAISIGRSVEVRCDGCPAPVAGEVSFVASQAEYTPPVLYGRESRSKLVFLVEARIGTVEPLRLHPGQPVDVSLR